MGMTYPRHSKSVIGTRRWKRLRYEILRRDGWQCVQCGARGRLEVDHVKPVRTHPELSFDQDNLQTLCPACHTRKTRIECGHAAPDPKRAAWRDSIKQMENKRCLTV